ncbi:cyclopropane fatty acid synthase [Chloropicon primus]|uniref:Cyclopropane fatty acid synthase n=1 Tax=Chloropicon primus TaxID=1764295 RepID=A0A5B8MD86_9CHLO|nr:cyclopropane fatty acid synthase [Chloropicon primus]UPQ97403.1 cyclopropane fatty acid synthase [Chloropicon primus]|eukprot:QDZ18191.1 cyclopropane fatty acid synthase [Chloropicon primus]
MVKVKRVGVVGGGIAGLSCAWLLKNGRPDPTKLSSPSSPCEEDFGEYEVELFEREGRLGGHAWTLEHEDEGSGRTVQLDLGFQVFNLTNYGNLVELFECLGVDSQPSIMSLSYSKFCDDHSSGGRRTSVEWSSNNGVFGIFSEGLKDVAKGDKWRLTRDLVRFEREAEGIIGDESLKEVTLEAWMETRGYSKAFAEHYMYPMCGAIWSSPKKQVKGFPILWLARFVCNHHLHKVTNMQRPSWRVVKGGSKRYVEAIAEDLRGSAESCSSSRKGVKVHTSCEVCAVARDRATNCYKLHYKDGSGKEAVKEFDAVVLATHADTSLKILFPGGSGHHSVAFRDVLQSIRYEENKVILHKDKCWMPKNERSWASWNVLEEVGAGDEEGAKGVCISYWANLLSSLQDDCEQFFVTLNPWKGIAPGKVVLETKLSHPQFSVSSQKAQERLKTLNGKDGLYLCGAWCGYGFHEDGVRSAVDVCNRLGLLTPWHYQERLDHLDKPESWSQLSHQFRALDPGVTYRQAIFMRLFDGYMKRCIRKGFLRVILPSGKELLYGDPDTSSVVQTHVFERKRRTPSQDSAEECVSRKSLAAAATLRVFDVGVFEAIVVKNDIGLGESFFRGKFVVDDLFVFLTVLSKNLNDLNSSTNKWVLGFMNFFGSAFYRLKWILRANTISNSRKNIEEHYDAGNAMYKLFLDSRMVYSSAIFSQDSDEVDGKSSILTWDTLEKAQVRKLREIAERCGIEKDDDVLEIGCGWGAMAIFLATEYQCRVTGITLSTEQLDECNKRAREAGVSDVCKFLLCDYREIPTTGKLYDKVISVEMIEAVGHEYFDTYFGTISRWLKCGGRATIQAISYPDHRYESQLHTSDFIKEHIFPGGHLPCKAVMLKCATSHGLRIDDCVDIGKSYAVTLLKWRENWIKEQERVRKLGYSQEFYLKYLFYFIYCEVGFNEGLILDLILTFTKL